MSPPGLYCQVCLYGECRLIAQFKQHLRTKEHRKKRAERFQKEVSYGPVTVSHIDILGRHAKLGLSLVTLCLNSEDGSLFYLCRACEVLISDGCAKHLDSTDHSRNYYMYTNPDVLKFPWVAGPKISSMVDRKVHINMKTNWIQRPGDLQVVDMPPDLFKTVQGTCYRKARDALSQYGNLLKLTTAATEKKITLQTYLETPNRNHHFLGLEHLVECSCEEQTDRRLYLCTICKLTITDHKIICHLLSFHHVHGYINAWHPSTLMTYNSYIDNRRFHSMMQDLAKQMVEIHGTTITDMKKVTLAPAFFSSVEMTYYVDALKKLEDWRMKRKESSLITVITPGDKLVPFSDKTTTTSNASKEPVSGKESKVATEKKVSTECPDTETVHVPGKMTTTSNASKEPVSGKESKVATEKKVSTQCPDTETATAAVEPPGGAMTAQHPSFTKPPTTVSKLEAKHPVMSCVLRCQDCNVTCERQSCYDAHVKGYRHKKGMKTIFETEGDEVDQGLVFNIPVFTAFINYIKNKERADPVIGLLHIVMCVSTRAKVEAFFVCRVCQKLIPASQLRDHLGSDQHIKQTLMHQNPTQLPFAWMDTERKEVLKSSAWEEENAQGPGHMVLQIIDLPCRVFNMLGKSYQHVCKMLDHQYFQSGWLQAPKITTLDGLQSHKYPQLGLQFLVRFNSNGWWNSLCLLCERYLQSLEFCSHVFSLEHVKRFLKKAHPGSLDSEAKRVPDSHKLLDMAKQAADMHSPSCIQKVTLSIPIHGPNYRNAVNALNSQKKMEGGTLFPFLRVRQKLVPTESPEMTKKPEGDAVTPQPPDVKDLTPQPIPAVPEKDSSVHKPDEKKCPTQNSSVERRGDPGTSVARDTLKQSTEEQKTEKDQVTGVAVKLTGRVLSSESQETTRKRKRDAVEEAGTERDATDLSLVAEGETSNNIQVSPTHPQGLQTLPSTSDGQPRPSTLISAVTPEDIMDPAVTNTALWHYLNDTDRTEPVIGLNMMTEFRWPPEVDKHGYFRCCSGDLVGAQYMSHIISAKHRYNYIKKVRPHMVKDWPCSVGPRDPSSELRDLAQQVERDEGWGRLKVTVVGSSTSQSLKVTAKSHRTADGTSTTMSPSLKTNEDVEINNISRTVAELTELSNSLAAVEDKTISKGNVVTATSQTGGKTMTTSNVCATNSKPSTSVGVVLCKATTASEKPSNTSSLTVTQACDTTATNEQIKITSNVLQTNSEPANSSKTTATTSKSVAPPHAATTSSATSTIPNSTGAKSHLTQTTSSATVTMSITAASSKPTAHISSATPDKSTAAVAKSTVASDEAASTATSVATPPISCTTASSKPTAHIPSAAPAVSESTTTVDRCSTSTITSKPSTTLEEEGDGATDTSSITQTAEILSDVAEETTPQDQHVTPKGRRSRRRRRKNPINVEPPELPEDMDPTVTNTALWHYLNNARRGEPVIGLSMMTEFQWPEDNARNYFRCDCCDMNIIRGQHMSHIISTEHRYNYIKKVRPHMFSDWKSSADPRHSRKLRGLAQGVEMNEGWGKLKVTVVTDPSLKTNEDPEMNDTFMNSVIQSVAELAELSNSCLPEDTAQTVSKGNVVTATSHTDGKTTTTSNVLATNSNLDLSSKSTAMGVVLCKTTSASDKPAITSNLTVAQVCDTTASNQQLTIASNVLATNSAPTESSKTTATTSKPVTPPQAATISSTTSAISNSTGAKSHLTQTTSNATPSEGVASKPMSTSGKPPTTTSSPTVTGAYDTTATLKNEVASKTFESTSKSATNHQVTTTSDVLASSSNLTTSTATIPKPSSSTGTSGKAATTYSPSVALTCDAVATPKHKVAGYKPSETTQKMATNQQVAESSVTPTKTPTTSTTCQANEDGSKTGHIQTYARSNSHDAKRKRDTHPLLPLFRAVSPASTCGSSPSSETSESGARSDSKTYGTAVGVTFMVTVTHEKRSTLFCLLCKTKPTGYRQHRSCIMHQSNYVRMRCPDLNSDLSYSELQTIVTDLAKQDIANMPQAVIMNSEREYEELTKADVPEALDRIKAILREQRGSQDSPSATDPQPESLKHQDMSTGLHEPSHSPDGNITTQRPDPLGTCSPSSPVHALPLGPDTQPEGPQSCDVQLESSHYTRTHPMALQAIGTQPVALHDIRTQSRTQPVAPEYSRTQPVTPRDTRPQPVAPEDSIQQQGVPQTFRERQEALPDPGTWHQAPLGSATQPWAPQYSGTTQKEPQHPGVQPQDTAQRQSRSIKLEETQQPLERPDRRPFLEPDSGHQQPFLQPLSQSNSAVKSRVSSFVYVKLSEAERERVIGLRSVVECQCGEISKSEKLFPFYMCRSCNVTVQLKHICGHIISIDHQRNYMWDNFPPIMAGIRDRLNMDEDGFELAVNAVAKREEFYQMDAEVILLDKKSYHQVRVAPYSEGIHILEDILRQQMTSSCPPADQQRPDQQSSQDPPHKEESSRPTEANKRRDKDTTDNKPSKRSLTETQQCLTTLNTNITVTIKQEVKQEDHTHSSGGYTEMRRPLEHGLDCVSWIGDAGTIKRRRISKSPNGGGTCDGPSGSYSNVLSPASHCPSPQYQDTRVKVEPSQSPSPQYQDTRVKVEPSQSPSPQIHEARVNAETTSVPTTVVSKLVQHCESLKMQPERKLELVLNSLKTIAASNFNLECPPTHPAESTEPSTTHWFIDSLLAKQPVLQSTPSTVSEAKQASPSLQLTSDPLSRPANKDLPSIEPITSIVDMNKFKHFPSLVRTKQSGRDVSSQEIPENAIVGRVKPRVQLDSNVNLCKRAAPKPAEDDIWNYENRQFMPGRRAAEYDNHDVQSLESHYRAANPAGEVFPVASNPQLDCNLGMSVGEPSATPTTVINPNAAPALASAYNTMASPFNPYMGSPMTVVNPNPTSQQFTGSDFSINQPTVSTVSPTASLPAAGYGTPLHPHSQVTHNPYFPHGYPYGTGAQNPYFTHGYPYGTGPAGILQAPGQHSVSSHYVNYSDGSTGGLYPMQTPPQQGAGQEAIPGGTNLTAEAWLIMHRQQQHR